MHATALLRHRVCPATTIPVSEDGPSREVAPVLVDPGALPRFHPLYPSRAPTPMLDRPGAGPGPGTGDEEGLLGLRPSSKHILSLTPVVGRRTERRNPGAMAYHHSWVRFFRSFSKSIIARTARMAHSRGASRVDDVSSQTHSGRGLFCHPARYFLLFGLPGAPYSLLGPL